MKIPERLYHTNLILQKGCREESFSLQIGSKALLLHARMDDLTTVLHITFNIYARKNTSMLQIRIFDCLNFKGHFQNV